MSVILAIYGIRGCRLHRIGAILESQDHSNYRNQFYWGTRLSGSRSLCVNYEGGTLKPEEM
ncbi:hypothetical protein BGX26_004415, partial [Mortierella sp. AD094]